LDTEGCVIDNRLAALLTDCSCIMVSKITIKFKSGLLISVTTHQINQ
jgi:hypothetical protein